MPASETKLDPDVVRFGAEGLLRSGEAARDQLQVLCDQLRDLEGERPWGSDVPGEAFREAYEPSTMTADAAYHMPFLVIGMSVDITEAAAHTEQVDLEVANALGMAPGNNGSSPGLPGVGGL